MLSGPLLSLGVVALALWTSIGFARNRRGWAVALCCALGTVAVGAWWVVAPLARRWAGWSDPDGDGMWGDMTNGEYGRYAVYGAHWGGLVGACSLLCGAALVALRRRAVHPRTSNA